MHEQKVKKEMEKQRDALADALYKKALALLQLEEDQTTEEVFSFKGIICLTLMGEIR